MMNLRILILTFMVMSCTSQLEKAGSTPQSCEEIKDRSGVSYCWDSYGISNELNTFETMDFIGNVDVHFGFRILLFFPELQEVHFLDRQLTFLNKISFPDVSIQKAFFAEDEYVLLLFDKEDYSIYRWNTRVPGRDYEHIVLEGLDHSAIVDVERQDNYLVITTTADTRLYDFNGTFVRGL